MTVREGLQYRGGIGQWAWILHRVSGLGVLVFLILHIADIFAAAFGPEVFNRLLFIYHSIVFKPLIVLLVFGVVYHALNGARLIAIDLWPRAALIHDKLWMAATAISIAVALASIVEMVI